MKDRYVFPAIFDYADDGISISFPDLPGCFSCGFSDEEALLMARDAMGGHLASMEKDGDLIPEPTPALLVKHEPNQLVVLIDAWMPAAHENLKEVPADYDPLEDDTRDNDFILPQKTAEAILKFAGIDPETIQREEV